MPDNMTQAYYIDTCEALDAVIRDLPKLLALGPQAGGLQELRSDAVEAVLAILQESPRLAAHQFAIAAALEAVWARVAQTQEAQ